MKKKLITFLKNSIYFIVISLVISSCIPQKKLIYLQNNTKKSSVENKKFINAKKSNYLIQSGDNLYIKISSLDEKTYGFFNSTSSRYSSNYMNSDISVYLNSYSVNDTGYVFLPVIGNLNVKDKTIESIKILIQNSLEKYLRNPTVIVKLVNYNITVLGEVKRPGKFKVYQDQISIFDALGLAGDVTDYGNRYNVLVVRQDAKGSTLHKIDLTDNKLLESEYYFLMPNDIIYIEPLKAKSFGARSFSWSMALSTITTMLVLLNYFK